MVQLKRRTLYVEADNPNAALMLDELFSARAARLINHLLRLLHAARQWPSRPE